MAEDLNSFYYLTEGKFAGRGIALLNFKEDNEVTLEINNRSVSGLKYLITVVLFYLFNNPDDTIFLDAGFGLTNSSIEEVGELLNFHIKEIEQTIKDIQSNNIELNDDELLDSIKVEKFYFEEDVLKIQLRVTSVSGAGTTVTV